MISSNGFQTGGVMITGSPGRVISRSTSVRPVSTSATSSTGSGSTDQPHRSAANSANASGRSLPAG